MDKTPNRCIVFTNQPLSKIHTLPIILILILLGFCFKGFAESTSSESASKNVGTTHLGDEIVDQIGNEVRLSSQAHKNYAEELNHSDLLQRLELFCNSKAIIQESKFDQAKKWIEPSRLCSEESAQTYHFEDWWYSKTFGWIHFQKWQGWLPISNHDLACVAKKIFFSLEGPHLFCGEDGLKRLIVFADRAGLKLDYLMNVIEILHSLEEDHL